MADVVNAMNEAIKSLEYAVIALQAPEGAFMRDTLAEMIEARQTVANMLAALERIVEVEGNGGSAIGMRHIALAAIAKAKGTNND
jgi:phosphoheptose isomerase